MVLAVNHGYFKVYIVNKAYCNILKNLPKHRKVSCSWQTKTMDHTYMKNQPKTVVFQRDLLTSIANVCCLVISFKYVAIVKTKTSVFVNIILDKHGFDSKT